MKWTVVHRENGLTELACEHGVGHPSSKLTPPKYFYGVHGCDGCCSDPSFAELETRMADAL